MISPQSLMMTVLLTDPDLEPSFSNFLTTAKLTPISANFPNTTCLPIGDIKICAIFISQSYNATKNTFSFDMTGILLSN